MSTTISLPFPPPLNNLSAHDRVIVRDDHAVVLLTKGYQSLIDLADVERVRQWKWCASVHGTDVRAVRRGAILSRFIMEAPEGYDVDHIDGDPLNNRRANMRIVTHAQNQKNTKDRSDNSSGMRGVFFYKKNGRFMSQIKSDGKAFFLGYFDTAVEAAKAYERARSKLHGSFSRTSEARI